MQFRVVLLRQLGARRPDRDWINGPWLQGDVRLGQQGRYRVLELVSETAINERLLPPLYEPALAGMGLQAIVFRVLRACGRWRSQFGDGAGVAAGTDKPSRRSNARRTT